MQRWVTILAVLNKNLEERPALTHATYSAGGALRTGPGLQPGLSEAKRTVKRWVIDLRRLEQESGTMRGSNTGHAQRRRRIAKLAHRAPGSPDCAAFRAIWGG